MDSPVILIRRSVYNKERLFPEFSFLHLLSFLLISITFFAVLEKIRQKQLMEALLQGDYKATVDKT